MPNLSVSDAVARRRSIRAFLPTEVPDTLIADILARATRAPSGGNLQPWHFYVLNGPAMARFRALMEQRMADAPAGEPPEYEVYPRDLHEPYRTRRFAVGEAMYALLNIPRAEKLVRLLWLQNNDRFFGAPAALFCFIDRRMGPPQWSDLGMVLQTAMLLFQEQGIDTCPQEAWSRWPRTVAQFVAAPDSLMLFCGMAIGHADPLAPVNRLRAERADPGEIIHFVQ
ncbi:MAG TPA: nitroreductase [Acetobacteraceae bacterium]|nr:nitroreductase [Acetobacteraceae bacterium]